MSLLSAGEACKSKPLPAIHLHKFQAHLLLKRRWAPPRCGRHGNFCQSFDLLNSIMMNAMHLIGLHVYSAGATLDIHLQNANWTGA